MAEQNENTTDKAVSTTAHASAGFRSALPKYFITVLAIAAIIVNRATSFKFEWTDILLFAIGVSPWLSSFFESFKLGKDGLEFVSRKIDEAKTELKAEVKNEAEKLSSETTEKINEVKESNDMTRKLVVEGAGGKMQPEASASAKSAKKPKDPSDPQKDQWGEEEANHRKMSARVEKIPNEDYLRRVIFRVESTDPDNFPLTDTVTFYLHPTFNQPVMSRQPVDNAAEIDLIAYGAFTAGAVTDNGKTQLEFDLMKLIDTEDPFFTR